MTRHRFWSPLLLLASLFMCAEADTAATNVFDSVLGIPLRIFTGRSSNEGVPFGRTTSCATECTEGDTFSYQNNMVHVFDYHSSAKMFGGIQEPQLAVTARVHITVASPCEMILALSHVRLVGTSSSSTDFSAALTSTPLRFAFQDGKVSNICPSTDEPVWVLNFKRAVLSTFQNSMGNIKSNDVLKIEEEDVSGSCTSYYASSSSEPGVYNITRVRDANCVSRPVPPSNSKLSSLLQLIPVFKNQQTCYQKITGGALKESICRENIRYPEFLDTPEDLPIIAVVTKLNLAYQFKADFVVIPNYNATRVSLVQDWEPEDKSLPPDWLSIVEEILDRFGEIKPMPSLFYDLTQLLKNLDYNQIQQLFINIAPQLWNAGAMSFLSVGTEPAMKLLVDFMKNSVISGVQLEDAVTYLAKRFEMNSPMLDLIEDVVRSDATLEVPLLKVKNYCEANREECNADKRIGEIKKSVDENASLNCKHPDPNATESEQTEHENDYSYSNIDVLDSLKNIGYWSHNVSLQIDECIRGRSTEVRYHALEAIRQTACDQYDYSSLLMAFQDPKLDDYSQIMVFRALARCPTEMLSSVVMQKILLENVTHVTSYIWSYASNNKELDWTGEMLADARLRNKYTKEKLRFSRLFRHDFTMSDKKFKLEIETVFSGYNVRPQYMSVKVSREEGYPQNIFEMIMRERNETLRSFYPPSYGGNFDDTEGDVQRYCSVQMNFFGYGIYSKEYDMDKKISSFSVYQLYDKAFYFLAGIIEYGAIQYFYSMFSSIGRVNYLKAMDVQLRYPTSMGMPINLKMNMTTGSQQGTLLMSYAKNFDAALSLDATHAQIGCKLKASCEFLPKITADLQNNKFLLNFNLPEAKSSLVDVNYDVYTFENDDLYPKYYSNETDFTSLCIPALQEFTGFTFCLDYYPRIRYWPIYTFKYGLSYQRDPGVDGIAMTIHPNSRENLMEMCVETPGRPSGTWSISKYELAQFINVNVTTPFFKLNGSGTYRDDVLFFKESGQAVNISGTFQYRGDEAPFVLINTQEVDEETNEKKIYVNFESSLLSTNVATSYQDGDDMTFNLNIPYHFKDDVLQRFKVSMASRSFNMTTDRRRNYRTAEASSFKRDVYSASVGLSQYKRPLITMECVSEYGDHIDTTYSNLRLSGEEKSLETIVSYVSINETYTMNTTSFYESPDCKALWSKTIDIYSNNSCIRSSLVMNNDTIYSLEAKYENVSGSVIQSNSTLLVPNYEDDAKYPILYVKYDQKFNYTRQEFYANVTKTYYDRSMNFTVAMTQRSRDGIVVRGNTGSAISYYGGMTLECSQYNPFMVYLMTTYRPRDPLSRPPNTRNDFEMDVEVVQPLERWNKKALKMKMLTKEKYMKTSLTDQRYDQSKTYNVEGITDYDVLDNMIDYGNKRFGRPTEA